jgi:hypothetical protein
MVIYRVYPNSTDKLSGQILRSKISIKLLIDMGSKTLSFSLCQKVPSVVACFRASAAPRPENSNSDEKDELFGLHTQITII